MAGARVVFALILLGLAAVFFVASYGPLHNLWAEYQDSPNSTYLLYGLPLIAAGVACVAGAAAMLRR